MVDIKIVNRVIVFGLIALLFAAAIYVLSPIIFSIIVAIFFAYVVHPLYSYVKKYIKGENISTFVFILVLLIIIGVPLWIFLPNFVKEIFDTYLYFQKIDLTGAVYKLGDLFFNEEIARAIAIQVNLFVVKFFSFSIDSFTGSFSNLADILLQFSVFLFTFYFVTRDSEKIKVYFSELSPLSKATEDKFAAEFRNITNAIVFGQIIIGVVQGLALGLGLWLLGIPKVLFLTTIAILASIIPIIGAWLVWIPVSLYLVLTDRVLDGAILFLYGLLFVSVIDNFLRPYFLSRQSNLGVLVSILGTVGGLYAFGILGLILGPLILSYIIIVVDFYKKGKLNDLFKE